MKYNCLIVNGILKTFPIKFSRFLRKKALLFVVFLTGACVLVLEIVATRILAPFFGNTIYSISSILGIILAALSLGYYFGGKYADRHPETKGFYTIIIISGFSVFLLQFLVLIFLPFIGYQLPLTTGPLVSSFFLFSLPSFLLGTLSPYAIRLQKARYPKYGVGRLSGEVFFASTLGSIFGSLSTGFFLIPNFGLDAIIIGVGFLLVMMGLLGLLAEKISRSVLFIIIFFTVLFVSFELSYSSGIKSKLVYYSDGLYQRILIFDDLAQDGPVRILSLDEGVTSGIFLDSDKLLLDYTKYYLLYQLFDKNIESILFLGGGAYTLPEVIAEELPEANVDVVEIEPSLYGLAQKYFGLAKKPGLKNHVQDARRFLVETDKKYDYIFADAYSSVFSPPVHLTTLEFFQLGKEKLNDGGIFIANIIGELSDSLPSFVFSEINTFRQVFPQSFFFAVNLPTSLNSQNIIFLGIKGEASLDFDRLKSSDNPFFKDLPNHLIDLGNYDLSLYPLIFDNYAPVEYMNKRLVKKVKGFDRSN